MSLENAYTLLYSGALIYLAVLMAVMLVRSIRGPRITDRILAVNMISTMVITSIVILSRFLEENYLLDVGLIYVMISFVSILILCAVYIRRGRPGKKEENRKEERREHR